jgi:hypothetical protein
VNYINFNANGGAAIYLDSSGLIDLAEIIASGTGQTDLQTKLRTHLLTSVGGALCENAEWYKALPFATENRPTNYEMGIVKLFEQARAIPAIRAEADGVLKSCANTLANLIDKYGPRAATPAQMANRKEVRW